MDNKITNFPIIAISDGIISYLQYVFGKPEMSPSEYRWSSDDRATQIFIASPYTITRDKVGDYPSITVARGNFRYQNRVMDNLESADANTFENANHRDLIQGPMSIICEAGSGPEATGLAQFISILMQSNRHGIAGAIGFLHKLTWMDISSEQPVKEEAEITRWQCTLTYDVTLYQPWFKRSSDVQPWRKLNMYTVNTPPEWESSYGQTTIGSPYLTDNSATFGFTRDDNPQILGPEFQNGWYYVTFNSSSPKKYKVTEITEHTLKLTNVDENGDEVDFNPTKNETIAYSLLWNSFHIDIELPKKNT